MSTLSMQDRVLGWKLGLGELQRDEPCHGYQNGCRCSECVEREEIVHEPRRRRVVLPWELDAA